MLSLLFVLTPKAYIVRKISIEYPEEDMPIALALSDRTKATKAEGAVNVFSGDLQLHLHTFLSYFTFWQDLLELCNSTSVKQTLLDHLKVIFLQQLLYVIEFSTLGRNTDCL